MNKNKQNKVSFADLARKIRSKYKRAEFDPIEKDDMEAELEALQVEQEYMRTQLGMNEPPEQQFRYGGKMYPNGGGFNPLPFNLNTLAPQKLPEDAYLTPEQLSRGMSNIYENALPNSYVSSTNPIIFPGYSKGLSSTPGNEILYINPVNNVTPKIGTSGSSTTKNKITQPLVNTQEEVINYQDRGESAINEDIAGINTNRINPIGFTAPELHTQLDKMDTLTPEQIATLEKQSKTESGVRGFWDKNKQYAPYAISGLSNIAGNLLLANMAKKNQQRVNPSLASPEKMNMEPQAEQLRKDASVSKNIGMKQARDLGLNAGATLANMGAIGSGVDRQLANSLTSLYGQQEQYNTGTANQFALQNQDAVNRANIMNAQFGQQTNQNRMSFFDDAIGTIPGGMKDIRMDKVDKEMRDALNAQALNSGGRNYYAKGDLFSKGGLTYEVKEVDANGNPTKTELVKDGSAAEKKYQELLLAPKTTFQKQKFNTKRS